MAPSSVDRQLREASRTLNTFITGCQARAISSGRPVGIALKRLSAETGRNAPISLTNPDNDNGVCLEVYYVEQPVAFCGYDRNSRVCLSLLRNVGLVCINFVASGPTQGDSLPVGWDADLFPTNTIRPGDVIEIGDSRFELLDLTENPIQDADLQQIRRRLALVDRTTGYYVPQKTQQQNTVVYIVARPINNTGQQVYPEYDDLGFQLGEDRPDPPAAPARPPKPFWTRPAPYKIHRQATFTSDEPYQLPEGTAIDLRASGVGNNFFYYPLLSGVNGGSHPAVDNDAPIFIMFTPEGRLSRVTYSTVATTGTTALPNQKFDQKAVVDNVFLLVGRRENIPAPPTFGTNPDPTLNPNSWTTATTEQRAKMREPINWLSGESRWVVVGAQSGRIVTIENGFGEPSPETFLPALPEERRNQQILAAREFAPEMSQLGGR
jgi:hypothetical protein